jgi:glycine cleavage system aminomethyltransferase T
VPDAEQVNTAEIAGSAVCAIGLDGMIGRGVLLLVAADGAEAVIETLTEAGAELLEPAAYEVLRVEVGLPGPDRELTEEYTPLEANLDARFRTKGVIPGRRSSRGRSRMTRSPGV